MKRLIIGVLMVVLLVGTVACSKSSESAPVPAPMPAPAPQATSIFGSKGSETPPVVIQEVPAPVINIPAPSPAPATLISSSGSADESWAGQRLIIRTANLDLVVVDVTAAMGQIEQLAGTYEGYIVSSNSWKDNDRLMGNIAIRVTAGNFDNAISALHALSVEVKSESTSGQDVTAEYVDLSAKLRNLEASESQLLELMKQAGKVEEILDVQRELVNTRGEIEQTKGRMQYLEQSSSMSLIQVTLEQSKLSVDFNADTRVVKEGQNVQFYPIISGGFTPYSYKWDFGDETTSTEEQPNHSYKSDGSYTVSLKVTDDRGNTAPYERANYITVLPGWNGGNVASTAWNGLVGFGRVLVDIIIWLGIFSPVWIVIGVIVYFAWWRRKHKKA
jgi:PKD repeat protein